MNKNKIYACLAVMAFTFIYSACKVPAITDSHSAKKAPGMFDNGGTQDTTNEAKLKWNQYFTDQNLTTLIDTALKNNQELNITMQEILVSQNEIKARKGEYLPFLGVKGAAGFDKPGRYTSQGALEESTEIAPGKKFPDPLPDYLLGIQATWEIDIWNKLHNAKKAAISRYLSSVEGKNFMVTNLIAEIANSYYELLALDNQLKIVKKNIDIQNNALRIVRIQKEAARVTELAVRRFEAQVLKTRSMQYEIQQQITETEN
ncbi:MAG: TolC family protein, partial [Mucilaginibacter polytrichastri]|nr:TolC family protein [Mucilaginibacter polytrichastri]